MPSFYEFVSFKFLISNAIIRIAVTAAAKSATGAEYMIPSIPISFGNTNISGSKNKICLVIDKNTPLIDFPSEVKKVDVTGCIKLMQVKKIKNLLLKLVNTVIHS